MADTGTRFLNFLGALSPARKLGIVMTVALIAAGFVSMFLWANQRNYQVLFNNLAADDAGAIVAELKQRNIPYKLGGNGNLLMVPADKVYELRLSLAGEGLPKKSQVGFEIFDETDFRTPRFVQHLNYRRALQGELARTINKFREIENSKVFIVLPKESVFVEDSKPATASIQVDLRHALPATKVAAIVHLVASAVEGLDPESVTVVDTRGRTIFRGGSSDDAAAMLSSTQLEYKRKIEEKIRKNVQSLLEGIVGIGKALVRVSAQVDFTKTTVNEEEYDPFTTAVRSKRNLEESVGRGDKVAETGGAVAETSDVVGPNAAGMTSKTKKDATTNYEINKITRSILRPAGKVTRLSVAAVIDGTYEREELEGGSVKRTYVPRSDEELAQFEEIVKGAVGYDVDREDSISVNSMAFARTVPQSKPGDGKAAETTIPQMFWSYRKVIINFFLVVLVFLLVVRPLLKSMRKMISEAPVERRSLPATGEEYTQLTGQSREMNPKEKALELSRNRPERAQQLIKQWVEEG